MLEKANIVLERPVEMDYETYKTYRALQNKALKQRIKQGVAFMPSNKYKEYKQLNK